MPPPHRTEALSVDGHRLSVRLSVPCLIINREWKGKLKIGRKKACYTGDPLPGLEVEW